MSNIREGTKWENELLQILGQQGFWASSFPKANDGSQPADIIALNKNGAHLIDAKVCSRPRFDLNRMEENQLHSMKVFNDRCDGLGWFAIKYPDDRYYMLPCKYLELLMEEGAKSVSKISESFTLENWIYGYRDRE